MLSHRRINKSINYATLQKLRKFMCWCKRPLKDRLNNTYWCQED